MRGALVGNALPAPPLAGGDGGDAMGCRGGCRRSSHTARDTGRAIWEGRSGGGWVVCGDVPGVAGGRIAPCMPQRPQLWRWDMRREERGHSSWQCCMRRAAAVTSACLLPTPSLSGQRYVQPAGRQLGRGGVHAGVRPSTPPTPQESRRRHALGESAHTRPLLTRTRSFHRVCTQKYDTAHTNTLTRHAHIHPCPRPRQATATAASSGGRAAPMSLWPPPPPPPGTPPY